MSDLNEYISGAAGHVPVMLDTVLQLLEPSVGDVVLDCTVGRGGHCGAIRPRLEPDGRYIGLDVDYANVDYVRETVKCDDRQFQLDVVRANFKDAARVLGELGVTKVDCILADLGFCSTQVDDASRGLSFQEDGPLDMRLDPSGPQTAGDLVNRLAERELADLIWRFGDERFSRRIARKIVEQRRRSPIKTTRQLADLCAKAYGPIRGRGRIDPATRTFQALRIAVNDELGALEALLETIPEIAGDGCRVVILSFHSLEDRLVKQAFRKYAKDGLAEVLTKKPLRATASEIAANPRSRSARCRAVRWLEGVGKRETD